MCNMCAWERESGSEREGEEEGERKRELVIKEPKGSQFPRP